MAVSYFVVKIGSTSKFNNNFQILWGVLIMSGSFKIENEIIIYTTLYFKERIRKKNQKKMMCCELKNLWSSYIFF